MISRLVVDITPLRESPAYRRLWLGSLLSAVGSQLTTFAVALQVYLLTHSSVAVGGVGLVSAVPAITCGLFAGSLVDAHDRRRIVLCASSLSLLVSVGLAAQAFAEVRSVWLLYVFVAVQSLVSSVNAPARRTFLPRLLPAEQIPAGAALTMLSMHVSLVLGPSLAGVLTAAGGLKFCYLVDAISFLAAMYGVYRLPPMRPDGAGTRPGARAVLDGLRFLGRSKVLTGALVSDLNATVLAMPIALFPAINAARFAGSPRTLGLMTTAIAVGGVLGSGLSGPIGRVQRQGVGMLVAGAVWGAALAGFGVVDGLAATLALLAVAGAADVSSVVLRSTVIQLATPDAYRGRINAAEFVVGAACPELGNFRAGAVASLTSPGVSAVAGGLGCVAGAAVIALSMPAFVRYRVSPKPAPEAELAVA
ncbi:MAG TPA: MFS transporter [Jatrophihabitans sp.]|nr:MFS transporter [Jatrophihabitans sp.]